MRARDAWLDADICCHTFRATGTAAYLKNGGTLENAQSPLGKCYAIVIEAGRRVMEAKRMAAAETWRRVS